ncbi:MAG: phosphoribosylglycinamide formyltransferase [Candidatus Omnitrophica bacterium]|nr:phosphoribosylglycinamide formyltransferase [Candidatus Omnitrophota bacterium]
MVRAAIAVCCSGRGSNLQAIIAAIRRGILRARIACVISDNPRAYALERALRAGLKTVVIPPDRRRSRESFDRILAREIEKAGARWVVLAGFMRILSPSFVRRFKGRIVNIHPALLPAFPGRHGVRDALRYGAKVTGVTVHFVDEQVDHGPIIAQEPVAIREDDTEETLLARVHKVEHRLYPRAIQKVVNGRTKIIGRKVLVR